MKIKMKNMNTSKRLTVSIAMLVVLSVTLCATSGALVYSMLSENDLLFQTGNVEINLNDGLPIIEETDIRIAPGMTLEKDFFIENNSTSSVYYRLYFGNLDGELADVIQITIFDGWSILYEGTASELTRSQVSAIPKPLLKGEKRVLTARFHFPDDVGNDAQSQILEFDLFAEAVQTKNNPDRLFD